MAIGRFFAVFALLVCSAILASAQTCTCIGCNCDGATTCPLSIPGPRGQISEFISWPCNGYCDLQTFDIQSTDGSTFNIYCVDDANYAKYLNGSVFSGTGACSINGGVPCFNAFSVRITTSVLHILVENRNLVLSAPLQYSSWVTTPSTATTGTTTGATITGATATTGATTGSPAVTTGVAVTTGTITTGSASSVATSLAFVLLLALALAL